ncbi:MAG TPA: hypothetical protein VGO59_00455 [Verrucomicrobiae bacterium]
MRRKKPKTGLIAGLAAGAAAIAAAIYFWPQITKMVSHGNQKMETADLTPTNTPPPPPPELTTEEVLQKVADAYKGMADYTAKGKTVTEIDMSALVPGKTAVRLSTTSSLQLARTNNFRLEWETAVPGGQPVKGVAWNSGRGNYVGYGPYRPNKVKTRDEAMAPAASSAFLLSGGIAEVFFSTTNSVAEAARNFTKTNLPSANGEASYVLTGEANHQNILLWVGKENFLIYQIEINLGGKMDEAELKKLPSTQRKAMEMMGKLKGTITETYDSIQTNKNLLASSFETSFQPSSPAGANAGTRSRRQGQGSMAGRQGQPGANGRQGRPQ